MPCLRCLWCLSWLLLPSRAPTEPRHTGWIYSTPLSCSLCGTLQPGLLLTQAAGAESPLLLLCGQEQHRAGPGSLAGCLALGLCSSSLSWVLHTLPCVRLLPSAVLPWDCPWVSSGAVGAAGVSHPNTPRWPPGTAHPLGSPARSAELGVCFTSSSPYTAVEVGPVEVVHMASPARITLALSQLPTRIL